MQQLIFNTAQFSKNVLMKNLVNNFLVENRRTVTGCASGCRVDKVKCPSNDPKEKNPCLEPPEKKIQKDVKKPFVSMWENPLCKPSEATCPQVALDTLYYKPTDKAKRKYQQTWVSCPKAVVKPKVVCENLTDKYPPMEKRKKERRPTTAKCHITNECSRGGKKDEKCLKITLPGCNRARKDVKCKLFRTLSDCKPPTPPYPSYSECVHPKKKKLPVRECPCLTMPGMCEVWTILREKMKY